MAKIKFVRNILTATVGEVSPGDVHDVTEGDAARYITAGWAEPVLEPVPASKPVARKRAGK